MALVNLFLSFFKLGLFGFGGGYAMLPLIFQSVQSFGFMSTTEFSRLVALSQITPGPVAINAATYVGFNYSGIFGAMAATAGVVLPSFVLVTLVARFMDKFQNTGTLNAILQGIRPATVGLIASAVIFIGETTIINGSLWDFQGIKVLPLCIFICTILLSGKFKISPIKITVLAGVLGAIFI